MPEKKAKQYSPSKGTENAFARALRKVGRVSGHLVEAHVDPHHPAQLRNTPEMQKALLAYSRTIEPWARAQSLKMLSKVIKKTKAASVRAMKKNAVEIHTHLKNVEKSDVGKAAVDLMQEQVDLIQSIPLKAAERAQKLSMEAFYNGTRAGEVATELMRSGKVSEADANRIARTEVARSNSVIIQARSQAVGSKQYIWRNSRDESVREAHKKYHGKKLDGMVFSWDAPPTLDDGTTGHPGTFPNCRCYPEPFFAD